MQSAVNVELSPEEVVTISVSAKDFADLSEGAIRVVRLPWLAECDCNEGIPIVPIQEGRPSFF